MSYISIKLPNNIVTLFLPKITTVLQINPDSRVTEDGEVRLTEDGEQRVTEDLSGVESYPELAAIKLPNHIISVSVPK